MLSTKENARKRVLRERKGGHAFCDRERERNAFYGRERENCFLRARNGGNMLAAKEKG